MQTVSPSLNTGAIAPADLPALPNNFYETLPDDASSRAGTCNLCGN